MKNIRFVLYLLKLKSKHSNISFLAISGLSHNKILVCHAHINMRTLTNISWLLVFSSKRTLPFLPSKTGSFVASVNMIKIGKSKFLFGRARFQFYFLLGALPPPPGPPQLRAWVYCDMKTINVEVRVISRRQG